MSKHHDETGDLHFEQIQHKGVGYEDRDLGSRGIIVFMVVLVVATTVLCLGVYAYFHFFVLAEQRAGKVPQSQPTQATAPNFEPPTKRFPKPALQTDDVLDMNKLRIENEAVLHSYGWVDQNAGVAHIPIDDAIKAVAQKGLPTRSSATETPAAQFGSGDNTVPGIAGGTRPATRQ